MRRSHLGAMVVLWAAMASGCGGARTAPVSGTVNLDGKPLAGATVSFTPLAGDAGGVGGSAGKTDEQGRYTLRTIVEDRPGAAVGKHRVVINLYKENPNNPDQAGKELVPARYSNNAKSELSCEVPSGGNNAANFDLKSK